MAWLGDGCRHQKHGKEHQAYGTQRTVGRRPDSLPLHCSYAWRALARGPD